MSYFVWYCIDCKKEISDIEEHNADFPGHRFVEVVRVGEDPIPTFIPDNIPTKEELQDPHADISIAWENVADKPVKRVDRDLYVFNQDLKKWVSVNRTTLTFSHRRTSHRRQSLVIGIANNALIGYYIGRDSLLTKISASCYSLKYSKGKFEIGYLKPGSRDFTKVVEFSLTQDGTYEATSAIELPGNILLQCWSKERSYFPVVVVEIASVLSE